MIQSTDSLLIDEKVEHGKVKLTYSETSFDSGYCTSPAKFTGFTPLEAQVSRSRHTQFAVMDEQKYFINSPIQSPYKSSLNANVNAGYLQISPLRTQPVVFSPFKESTLSPFKLISQSPSKGSFDEWDKDFIASFEENLFGGLNTLSEDQVEELLKSPQGKAMLERRNSPLRMTGHSAVRKLKISPHGKSTVQTFQPLSGLSGSMGPTVKHEPIEVFTVKKENTVDDHMYGQTLVYVNSNSLSAIDPNKMCATPIKPRLTNVDAPKRKLAMKAPGHSGMTHTFILQKENQVPVPTIHVQQAQDVWPSKEKLKFARTQFTQILNSAVDTELKLLKAEKEKKEALLALKRKQTTDRESRNIASTNNKSQMRKVTGGKVGKSNGGKSKGKVSRKAAKKGKYPEIQKFLSKPALEKGKTVGLQMRLFPEQSVKYDDPGFYPDDDDDIDVDDETWTGPVPFYSQVSSSDSSDDDWGTSAYKFETIAGNRVKVKKRTY